MRGHAVPCLPPPACRRAGVQPHTGTARSARARRCDRAQLGDEGGGLVWTERRDGQVLHHTREPGSTLGRSAWIGLLSVLPIEWLL